MIKKTLIFFLLLLPWFVITAQPGGYGGKKLYISLTPINGIKSVFSSLNAEYMLFRNITVSAGFNFGSTKYKQAYTSPLYATLDNKQGIPDKAKVTNMGGSIEIKKYFNSLIELPAPNGFFCFAGFKYNNLTVKGNYYLALTHFLETDVQDQYISYNYKGLGSYTIEAGIGNHWFLKKWLVAGLKTGLSFNKILKSINPETDKILSPVGKGFGYNLAGFGLNSKYLPIDCNLGLSIYGEIGILLF